jgi:hypothetical protein
VTTSEPLSVGVPISFPSLGGDNGSIAFPAGSTPVQGNVITLTTALSLPAGYPTSIPPGYDFPGVGATPIAPWLSYKLSEGLNYNGDILVNIVYANQPPPGDYYLAVYDITSSPNVPLGVSYVLGLSLRERGAKHVVSVKLPPLSRARLRGHPADSIAPGDLLYFGLFYLPGGSATNTQAVAAAGGASCTPPPSGLVLPAFNTFQGCSEYSASDAPAGSTISLTSATTDFTGGLAPPQQTGIPVFYLGMQLASNASLVVFKSQANLTMGLQSPLLANGGSYDIYGYDLAQGNQFYHAGPITAGSPAGCPSICLAIPSPLDAVSVASGDLLLLEVVQD